MPTKKRKSSTRAKKPTTAKPASSKPADPEREKFVAEMVELLRRARHERVGPKATFEQQSDAGFEIMREILHKDEGDRLRESVTDADEVEVDGKKFRRLEQASSATYFGRFGSHHVEEHLYRRVGVHNGPTMKPLELRCGIVEHMTPDMARVVGELSADKGSRPLQKTLRAVGYTSPSRAFLADHVTAMGDEIADVAATLESAVRETEEMPAGVASISCGLDRMSVRMSEVVDGPPCSRAEPYAREAPPLKEYHYRKAWVGSASAYDGDGRELHTWRIAAEADADPAELADRVAADVAWLARSHPDVPVHCVQDAAPELRAMEEALARALPADMQAVVLVDFEHLMGYLDAVVDADDPDDTNDMKGWYRSELLRDDSAVERICANLRALARRSSRADSTLRAAIAAALRYTRNRKNRMRYASFYEDNLPIGSGATESTCWQMQQRVKLPGQSWEPKGLRGTLAIRALVISERWESAWNHYAASHRADISISA
jgi:hypothetical protein